MKLPRLSKPSPSLVIACFALAFSMAGTGYAAVKINGKDIKKGTVAGKALKKNTLTGTQINESKLGKVPSAQSADSAASAANAGALSGATAADFARNANFVRVFKTMNVGDADITLVTSGDISVKMSCKLSGGLEDLRTYATTATDGALLDSEDGDSQNPLDTTTDPTNSDIGESITASSAGVQREDLGYDDTGYVMNAASTHLINLLEGSATKVVNRSGHSCIYAATYIVE